ncbi:MAG: TRAP transporter substrate-binding protein DctP [Desulfitobacteriaceae bacterium]|nr:TRAP transporter substrate-binding protein DctP [Desulfitobacteriaceae bacterium]MDD4753177.1 TRAP transporter substrate-binding protein DctP [Desulfitobacteriaceae bacterium]
MKKYLVLLLVLALAIGLAGCGGGSENNDSANENSEAEKIVLKFGTHLTDKHNLTLNAAIPWMERVTELTDGQVTFEHYPNSQMGKATDTYKLVKSGVLDIGYTLYMEDTLPLLDLPMLPNLYEDCAIGTSAYWDVLNQAPLSDNLVEVGLKPLMAIIWEPYTIATVKSKPATMADFSKLKLRSSGGLHDEAAAALGITPVSIPASESLEALEKGTVDGYWGSTTSWLDYQFTQVLKYAINNIPLNGWGGIFAMNIDVYNSLPDNVKEAIDTANEEMNAQLGPYIKEYCAQAWKDAEAAGMEFYQVSDDVIEETKTKLEPITKAWLEEQDKAGYPATEVYNQFLDSYEKHAK